MADCTQGGAHQDLKTKYKVSGFPTVVFTDSSGNEVGRLGGRSPDQVKSQIEAIVAQYGAPTFEDISVEDGLAKAREQGKPLGVLFTGTGKEEERTNAVMGLLMADELEALRERFVWIARPLEDAEGKSTDEAKELRARKGGTIVLLKASGEVERVRDRVVGSITRPTKLDKDLEKALEKAAEE